MTLIQNQINGTDPIKPLRIILIAYACNPEWVSESYVGFQWFRHLKKYHKVMLITRNVNKKALLKIKARNVYYIKTPNFLESKRLHSFGLTGYFLFNLKVWFTIRKKVLEFNPDLIHLLTPIAPRYSTYLSYLNIPLILGPLGGGLMVHPLFRTMEWSAIIRNQYHRYNKLRMYIDPFLINTYTKATKILVSGNYILNQLRSKYKNKAVQVLETGVDNSYFNISADQDNVPIKVLFVGRLFPLKGAELLLRAFAKAATNSNILLNIIGSGPQEVYLKNLANELGIYKYVQFHGWISQAQLKKIYRESNIFCLPTIKDASGNVLLEAMAVGLPIITTNFAGPAEIVDDSCGILINLTNKEDYINKLAISILKLANNRNLRIQMGYSGKRRCRQLFTWDSKIQKVSDIYKEVISGADYGK